MRTRLTVFYETSVKNWNNKSSSSADIKSKIVKSIKENNSCRCVKDSLTSELLHDWHVLATVIGLGLACQCKAVYTKLLPMRLILRFEAGILSA